MSLSNPAIVQWTTRGLISRGAKLQRLFLRRQKVVDDDIRALDQPPRNLGAFLRLQIDRDRFLVAIDRQKVRADVADERRPPSPRLVAASGLFDLDDARSPVAEELRAERAGQDAREIGDENAVQRQRAFAAHRVYFAAFSTSAA